MVMLDFPRLRQVHKYDCGAIVTQAILEYYGKDIREDKIIKLEKTKRGGTSIGRIIFAFRKYKLKQISGRFTISEVKKFISKGHPVILVLQAWDVKNKDKWENWMEVDFRKDLVKVNWSKVWKDGHYVIAIGYDKNKMYFADPGSIFKEYLTFKELMDRWHDTS